MRLTTRIPNRRLGRAAALLLLLRALAAPAQYVGKVGQGIEKKPTLRATAVYEYTGAMAKPNASRLVPVVVWDGERYQPGGLYLAQPEPLAVAPGTQYVLEQTGVPEGYFNIASAGELAGAWVGLGRFAPELPHLAPKRLAASRTLPRLTGGSGRGRADDEDDDNGSEPVLHRKAGSESGSSSSAGSSSGSGSSGDGPTLHRRDGGSGSSGGTSDTASSAPPVDPDRPTLHRPTTSSSGAPSGPNDPDRPTLHRHAGTAAVEMTAPDPDRPHLRYGQPAEPLAEVLPVELKELPAGDVTVGEVVGVSDVSDDVEEPHNFRYSWPSSTAESEAVLQMHALALRALADQVQASFGPAAKENAALKQAADEAEAALRAPGSAAADGTVAPKPAAARHKAAAPAAPVADPLTDADFHAFQLSYGGGVTYVYTAHTLSAGAARRYVTVIAEPDFYGRPHAVLAQTTRADTLGQTPALHLIDAVDADGDHRAELLFSEQTVAGIAADGAENAAAGRQFALYSVSAGEAAEVYSTAPGVVQ